MIKRTSYMATGTPVLLIILWLTATLPLPGQLLHPTDPLPSFEVATIKPWQPTAPRPSQNRSGASTKVMKESPVGEPGQVMDRVDFIGQISLLIASAYNQPIDADARMVGGPDWLRSESHRYQVQAKIDDTRFAAMRKMTPSQQQEQVALMEQSLLAYRFKLKVHFEHRELPLYALIVAKGGSKLNPVQEGSPKLVAVSNGQGSELTAKSVTLDEFVHSPLLGAAIDGRTVEDRTGLKGQYDFSLKWEPEQPLSGSASEQKSEAPSFFTAVQEQLGLRLVPSKGLVEVIVIDHIEPPSSN